MVGFRELGGGEEGSWPDTEGTVCLIHNHAWSLPKVLVGEPAAAGCCNSASQAPAHSGENPLDVTFSSSQPFHADGCD